MKIIHTSDWHLGNRLMECSRASEQQAFLEWLTDLLSEEKPDALLVSGDIFDTGTPGEGTREMYNNFLSRADSTGCGRVIITGGNHDSVAQLESTRSLLARYHCSLVSHLSAESAEECLIPLHRGEEEIGLVCAVPFLRVSDVSIPTEQAEGATDGLSYRLGVKAVYDRVAELAKEWKKAHRDCPVICMGHLPVCGVEKTHSTRNITVGSVDTVASSLFSDIFDYVALGHIHRASATDNRRIRYCGSPLPMSMDEGNYNHSVLIWENEPVVRVREIPVPQSEYFTVRRCESRLELENTITALQREAAQEKRTPWIVLKYAGGDLSPDELKGMLQRALPTARLFAKRVVSGKAADHADSPPIALSNYTAELLFERKIGEYIHEHPDAEPLRAALTGHFTEALSRARQQS